MAINIWKSLTRTIRLVVLIGAALGLAANAGLAQNAFDRGTPAESKGGLSSLSSYVRDKIETVNLANGNLNVHIPLVTIGGRGSASFTISLSYNSKLWSSQHEVEIEPVPQGQPPGKLHHYTATFNDGVGGAPNGMGLGAGWRISKAPAIKVGLPILMEPLNCPGITEGTNFKYGLTKVTLGLPDGSEVQMRDVRTDGAPYKFPDPCHSQADGNRGRVWRSVDGSAITYVTDVDNGVVTGQLSGWVFLPDGTRLRMVNARCKDIIDPDGNFIHFAYDDVAQSVTYTDQLGRQVVLQGGTVTVKGYNGTADRVISLFTGQVAPSDNTPAPNLRSDYQNTSLYPRPFVSGDLTNTFEGGVNQHAVYGNTPHYDLIFRPDPDPSAINNSDIFGGETEMSLVTVVTRLNLLDGRSFIFRYNPWGELAEIVYPGGGVSQIDYAPLGSARCEATLLRPMLNRGVAARRVFNNGAGSGVDATWTYSRTPASPYPYVTVEAHQGDVNGSLVMSEKHYFLALDAEYVFSSVGGNFCDGTHDEKFENAKEVKVERQTGSGMQTEDKNWVQRLVQDWSNEPDPNFIDFRNSHFQEQGPNDDRMTLEDTTLENGKLKRVRYNYDDFNNVTRQREYEFGQGAQGSLVRDTTRTYLGSQNGYCYTNLYGLDGNCGSGLYTDPAQAIHRRRLLLNENVKDGAGNIEAYAEYQYDNYTNDGNHAGIQTNPGMIQYDGTWFAPFVSQSQPRGNRTSVKRLISGSIAGGTYATAYSQYDEAGNVVKTKDPLGNLTTISYADNFGNGSDPGIIGAAPPSSGGPTFAFPTLATNALTHQVRTQYDYSRGVVTGVKDPNLVITKTEHNDPYDRITQVIAGFGLTGSNTSIAQFSYPTPSSNTTTVTKQLDDTRWLTYRDTYDGFGRAVTAAEAEDGRQASTNFTISSSRILDGLGRIRFASNPSRGSGATTNGWTRTAYDLAGRVIDVATFSGDPNTQPPDYPTTNANWTGSVVTTYASEVTTVRDQANKQRRSAVDGLGRLTKIEEMNEAPATSVYATTTYGYDARGNLNSVTQGPVGSQQTRSFSYDKLSRLTDATNPENGHIGYSYDLASNLTAKTDGRFTTTYFYDSLNRVLTRTYTGTPATPTVTYAYDTATNGVGRLASVTTTGMSTYTYTSYDPLGRPTAYSQATNAQTYAMSASYNKAGMMLTETYPSGRVISTSYDSAGRLSGIIGQKTGEANKTYASTVSYTAHGAIGSMQLGNNLWEHTNFNSRLQPTQIGLGTTSTGSTNTSVLGLDYTFGTSASTNNGNVQSQTITVGTTGTVINQTYTYDQVNRLLTASEGTAWTQNYGYDQVGNRWVTGYVPNTTLTPTASNHINSTNNRLVMGLSHYDGSGNLDTDAVGSTFAYDGENRQVTASVGGQPATYGYDGDGHRVMKAVGPTGSAVTTVFVYDAMGKQIAEYRSDPVPPAPNGGGTSYLTTDHLGSTRVVTKQNQSVQARYDYLPFGEELGAGVGSRTTGMGYSAADSTRQKFTSKERDDESKLDYFLARYYSSAQGRFTSPDDFTGGPHEFTASAPSNPTFYADLHEPATLNKYQYCLNSPLRYVDPDGHQQGPNLIEAVGAEQQQRTANVLASAGLGTIVHLGRTGVQDGTLRLAYDASAKARPRTEAGIAERNALKAETRQKMTPLGRAISEAADKSREGRVFTPEGASKPNVGFTQFGRAGQVGGGLLLGAGVVVSAINIANAPEGQKGQAVIKEGTVWGGALAGGQLGAEIGAAAGPWGALGGGIIGSVVGGATGGKIADSGFKLGGNVGPIVGPNGQREPVK